MARKAKVLEAGQKVVFKNKSKKKEKFYFTVVSHDVERGVVTAKDRIGTYDFRLADLKLA